MSEQSAPTAWEPTAAEMQMAMSIALSDALPWHINACLIHGSPVLSYELDVALLRRVTSGPQCRGEDDEEMRGISHYILNGLSRTACERLNLAYRGFEELQVTLYDDMHVENDRVLLLPPSGNTAVEARNFLFVAQENGWRTLAIASQPHHQLRCFLQIIALMPEVDYFPKVYNAPAPAIPWNHPMVKPVPPGTPGGDVVGTLAEHIEAEYKRIVMYAQPPGVKEDGTPQYTRHATIPEMLAYIERREKEE